MTALEIADALARFVHADQVVELRALNVGGPRRTVAGWFDGRHLLELARSALAITRKATGVYFTPNPVHPDLLARCPNREEEYRHGRYALTTDADILERRYLFVDLDPDRTDGVNDQPSTADELATSMTAAVEVIEELRPLGWAWPAWMRSGNGTHLLFPLSAPAPAASKVTAADPLRETLSVLKMSNFRGRPLPVQLDAHTYTAARMLKVPGTWAKKGEATADRPYRTATILEFPDDWTAPAAPPAAPAAAAGGDRESVREVQPHAPAAADAAAGGRGRRAGRREAPEGRGLFDADAGVHSGPER